MGRRRESPVLGRRMYAKWRLWWERRWTIKEGRKPRLRTTARNIMILLLMVVIVRIMRVASLLQRQKIWRGGHVFRST